VIILAKCANHKIEMRVCDSLKERDSSLVGHRGKVEFEERRHLESTPRLGEHVKELANVRARFKPDRG
jgi:hypothetical protein